MSERVVQLRLIAGELSALADLVGQFRDLVSDGEPAADPAIARLVPDAYANDAEAALEFRRLTQDELLGRRAADAPTLFLLKFLCSSTSIFPS